MGTIAFFQNRLGRTDGVSLEVDKWKKVLIERLGQKVVYCSGNDDVPGNYVIPEIYAHHPTTWKILRNGTVENKEFADERQLEKLIYDHADVIEQKLLKAIDDNRISILAPNNLCSGGYQPASAMAFHRVFRKTGIPAIGHSHDFYFEDSGEVNATCHTVASIYDRYFPPKLPNVQHVVINRLSQGEIKRRKNIDATVVPNVFDFDQPQWEQDDYNKDLREGFGIGKDDLVFNQATRILDRKGIEMAIDLMAELEQPSRRKALIGAKTASGGTFKEKSRLVLLCAGIIETIGISGDYWGNLTAKAKRLGVDLVHVGERVKHSRGKLDNGQKVWSLWDSYVYSDFVTYPSVWEGWGNQFIEAVFAKLPVFLFEYPVYVTDLAQAKFQVVSVGAKVAGKDAAGLSYVEPAIMRRAADEVVAILQDPAKKKAMGEHNYAVGKQFFGLDTLERLIKGFLVNAGVK
jgi:glycosyltransferase involved in cell wall biosynthesis